MGVEMGRYILLGKRPPQPEVPLQGGNCQQSFALTVAKSEQVVRRKEVGIKLRQNP